MNNKYDHERISNKFIFDNCNVTGNMVKVIGTSLKTGIFPDSWKKSTVTPIEKVPRTKKCEEFRPINSLKTWEKIIEKVVKDQVEKYIENREI